MTVTRSRLLGRLILVLLLLLGLVAANRLYFVQAEPHFDFVAFWSAGKAVGRGLDPYDRQVLVEMQRPVGYRPGFCSLFYYPLWTGALFAPLGLLPFRWAAAVWQALNQVMLLAAIGLALAGLDWRPSPRELLLIVSLCLLYHPTLVAFLDGQISILVLLILTASFYLLHRQENRVAEAAAGGLLALTLLKPQLVFLVLPVTLFSLLLRRRWAAVLGFVGMFAAMFGFSWVLSPGWTTSWLADRGEQMVSSQLVPSVWGVAHDLWPSGWLFLGGLASIVLLAWLGYVWRRCRHSQSLEGLFTFTVVVGQLVAPFMWVYDQVLLILPLMAAFAWSETRPRRVAWWTVLGLWTVVLPGMLYVLANVRGRATANALLPFVLLCLLAFLLQRSHREHALWVSKVEADGVD
jgi:hypothetical protein